MNNRSSKTKDNAENQTPQDFQFDPYIPHQPKPISFGNLRLPVSPIVKYEYEDGTICANDTPIPTKIKKIINTTNNNNNNNNNSKVRQPLVSIDNQKTRNKQSYQNQQITKTSQSIKLTKNNINDSNINKQNNQKNKDNENNENNESNENNDNMSFEDAFREFNLDYNRHKKNNKHNDNSNSNSNSDDSGSLIVAPPTPTPTSFAYGNENEFENKSKKSVKKTRTTRKSMLDGNGNSQLCEISLSPDTKQEQPENSSQKRIKKAFDITVDAYETSKKILVEKDKQISDLQQLITGLTIKNQNLKSANNPIKKSSMKPSLSINNNKNENEKQKKEVHFSKVYTIVESESNYYSTERNEDTPSSLRKTRPSTPHPKHSPLSFCWDEPNKNKNNEEEEQDADDEDDEDDEDDDFEDEEDDNDEIRPIKLQLPNNHVTIDDPTYGRHTTSSRQFYRKTPIPTKFGARVSSFLKNQPKMLSKSQIEQNNKSNEISPNINEIKEEKPKIATKKYDGIEPKRPQFLTPAKLHYMKVYQNDETPKNLTKLNYALTPGALDSETQSSIIYQDTQNTDITSQLNNILPNTNNNINNKISIKSQKEEEPSATTVISNLNSVFEATEKIRNIRRLSPIRGSPLRIKQSHGSPLRGIHDDLEFNMRGQNVHKKEINTDDKSDQHIILPGSIADHINQSPPRQSKSKVSDIVNIANSMSSLMDVMVKAQLKAAQIDARIDNIREKQKQDQINDNNDNNNDHQSFLSELPQTTPPICDPSITNVNPKTKYGVTLTTSSSLTPQLSAFGSGASNFGSPQINTNDFMFNINNQNNGNGKGKGKGKGKGTEKAFAFDWTKNNESDKDKDSAFNSFCE